MLAQVSGEFLKEGLHNFPSVATGDLIFQYTTFSLGRHRREAVSLARGRWQGKKGQRTGGDMLSLDQTELISASGREAFNIGLRSV